MTGWPWPLDSIQTWFEDLWTWIGDAAADAVSIVSTWITDALNSIWNTLGIWSGWIVDSVGGAISGLSKTLSDVVGTIVSSAYNALSGLIAGISQAIAGLPEAVGGFVTGVGQSLGSIADTILRGIGNFITFVVDQIWSWVNSALTWATDVFRWLYNSIAETVSQTGGLVIQGVMGAFDAASTAIGQVLNDIFGGLTGAFTAIGEAIQDLTSLDFLYSFLDTVKGVFSILADMLTATGTPHSVVTPGDAWANAQSITDQVTNAWAAIHSANTIAEALTLGLVDVSLDRSFDSPQMRAALAVTDGIHSIMNRASVLTPLTYYFNSAFTPAIPDLGTAREFYWRGFLDKEDVRQLAEWHGYKPDYQLAYVDLLDLIPGPQDLIRFVVREVIVYAEFEGWMVKQGFAVSWSLAFWEAHWVLPAFDRIVDAFHRGIITPEERDKYIIWHDFKPEPRPGISKSDLQILAGLQKTLIPRVDLRRGWELGKFTDKELEDRYTLLGYEDDAPLMADIQKAVALDAEIGDVRRAWTSDYQSGLITQAQFRANLESLNIVGPRQDYYIEAARIRRERVVDLAHVDIYVDGYIKDLIQEEDLRDRLTEVLVDPEEIDLTISKAYVRKYQKPKPPQETTEDKAAKEAMKYRVAYLIQLFRTYAIEKDELVSSLVEAGVDPSVAAERANYEALKRPLPKPSPDVIARAKEEVKVQTVQVRAAIEEFRSYVVDESELLNRLIKLGLSEALAMATVQLESIKRPAPPISPEEIKARQLEERIRRLRVSALIEQYRRYAIEKDEFTAALIGAGVDPSESSTIADLEETRRPTPKPVPAEVEAKRREERLRSLRTKVLTEQFLRYIILKDDFARGLVELGLDPSEASAMADLEELRRPVPGPTPAEVELRREEARVLKLREGEAVEKFRAELISAEVLRTSLLELGYSEDLAQAIVNLEMLRRPPPPISPEEVERRKREERLRSLRSRTLIEQYRSYTIEKDELTASLIAAGLDPSEALAKSNLEETRRPTLKPPPAEVERARLEERLRSLRSRTLIEQYRSYTIEKTDLIRELVGIGLNSEEASAIADLEEARRPVPGPSPEEVEARRLEVRLRELRVATLTAQYSRYALEKADLMTGLILAGLDPAEAKAKADLEEARRPTPKPSAAEIEARRLEERLRSLRSSALVEQYKRFAIEKDELVSGLVEAGLNPEEARAKADLEESRRPTPKPSAAEIEARRLEERVRTLRTRALIEQYRRFSMEKDELVAGLIGLGLDPSEAAAVADLEESRRPTPKPSLAEVEARREAARILRLREGEAVARYRLGAITAEELKAFLLGLGYSEELAAAIVAFEVAKLKPAV